MEETMGLLDVIQEILPIGPDEWEMVATKHCTKYPANLRDKDSLRRKFNKLAATKMPTGDPKCPDDVRYAKMVSRKIEDKMESVEELEEEELGFPVDDAVETASTTGHTSTAAATATSPTKRNAVAAMPIRRGRPPLKPPSTSTSSTDQLLNLMMLKLVQDQDKQEERREERRRVQMRETRRQDMMQMMMVGMLTRVMGPQPSQDAPPSEDAGVANLLKHFEDEQDEEEQEDDK